ncbi:RNA exonuclease 3 [Cladobotryum mycophilum]|uniref:RNA exonuclease 3 n=1 Tax=Cladobotryum mycophilum TaxID=491253 RepID=A0ABR0SUB3_9HYPO
MTEFDRRITTPPLIDPEYGPIELTEEYLWHMQTLIHPTAVLEQAGYILHQLSATDLERKKRCFKCHRVLPAKKQKPGYLPKTQVNNGGHSSKPKDESSGKSQLQKSACKFHPGSVSQRKWTCCNGNTFAPPCTGNDQHTPRFYAPGELAKDWQFFHTPESKAEPVAAVVLDCEMGTNVYGDSELIRISVVEYFSRVVLLDSLVWPDIKMQHYNTRFSGVTRQAMISAKQTGKCIVGRANVRKRLWKFIGPETIVIGHATHGDLNSLRWIHPMLIDTLIIETQNRPPPPEKEAEEGEGESAIAAVAISADGDEDGDALQKRGDGEGQEDTNKTPKKKGGLSLKALSLQRLDRVIQVKGQGHDSLEDAIATRDILHWNVIKAWNDERQEYFAQATTDT